MKPGAFRYVAPKSLDEALAILADLGEDVSILAGGQSLVAMMNLRLARPDLVVDINHIPGLSDVSADAGGATVGALARAAAVERDAGVRLHVPVLARAISYIGHPQIRNRTTIGGNVAHADPSSELPGVIACLEGSVALTSQRGTREVGWDEFFVSIFTTCKEPDELVTSVRFPVTAGWQYSYDEIATRHGDYPMAGVCVAVSEQEGRVTTLRVAVVGVSNRPVRLSVLESLAKGRFIDAALIDELADQARSEVPASDDAHVSAAHRAWMVGTLVRRMLTTDSDVAA